VGVGVGVAALGFRVEGLPVFFGFRVKGLRFTVYGLRFRAQTCGWVAVRAKQRLVMSLGDAHGGCLRARMRVHSAQRDSHRYLQYNCSDVHIY
jgi:hypothetical protein